MTFTLLSRKLKHRGQELAKVRLPEAYQQEVEPRQPSPLDMLWNITHCLLLPLRAAQVMSAAPFKSPTFILNIPVPHLNWYPDFLLGFSSRELVFR